VRGGDVPGVGGVAATSDLGVDGRAARFRSFVFFENENTRPFAQNEPSHLIERPARSSGSSLRSERALQAMKPRDECVMPASLPR